MAEQFQEYQHSPRNLTEAEKTRLQNDSIPVSEFKKNKLEKEAQRNWDLFYKRNSTNFFKDRHWTCREFQELCSNEGKLIHDAAMCLTVCDFTHQGEHIVSTCRDRTDFEYKSVVEDMCPTIDHLLVKPTLMLS